MKMFDDVGKRIIEILEETGDITILSVQTFFYTVRGNFAFSQ